MFQDELENMNEPIDSGQPEPAEQSEPCDAAAEPSSDEWRTALETAVKQRDEYLAMAQRAQADYQNFKRRSANVRTDAYDEGVRETLSALLPSIDNLERALEAAQLAEATGALHDGVEMTLKLMLEATAKLGLTEVPSLGEAFDPDIHNAVTTGPGEKPGTVIEVFQKGYRVKDRMIRYAMVKIAAES